MINSRALILILVIILSACGASTGTPKNADTPIIPTGIPESTLEAETFQSIPTFTALPGTCSTPSPNELNDFIKNSITMDDNGKTFFTHVTSRFWIYLDDRVYPLQDLLAAIPEGLLGYISNGSVRGPQCYPIMFEAIHEGKGLLMFKDFQLSIIIDNNSPASSLPLN